MHDAWEAEGANEVRERIAAASGMPVHEQLLLRGGDELPYRGQGFLFSWRQGEVLTLLRHPPEVAAIILRLLRAFAPAHEYAQLDPELRGNPSISLVAVERSVGGGDAAELLAAAPRELRASPQWCDAVLRRQPFWAEHMPEHVPAVPAPDPAHAPLPFFRARPAPKRRLRVRGKQPPPPAYQ